jgi:hypothetical protein
MYHVRHIPYETLAKAKEAACRLSADTLNSEYVVEHHNTQQARHICWYWRGLLIVESPTPGRSCQMSRFPY